MPAEGMGENHSRPRPQKAHTQPGRYRAMRDAKWAVLSAVKTGGMP